MQHIMDSSFRSVQLQYSAGQSSVAAAAAFATTATVTTAAPAATAAATCSHGGEEEPEQGGPSIASATAVNRVLHADDPWPPVLAP